jgi:hypothetical protein
MENTSPTSPASAITAVFAFAAGYISGDYVAIVFGAFAGSLWTMNSAVSSPRWAGVWLVLKLTLAACVLSGLVAGLLTPFVPLAIATKLLSPTAFFIAAIGDRWVHILDSFSQGVTGVVNTLFSALSQKIRDTLGAGK